MSLQVQQVLIWVWAESGGDAFLESMQRGPAVNPLKQSTPADQFTSSYINYVRDLPGDFQEVGVQKKSAQTGAIRQLALCAPQDLSGCDDLCERQSNENLTEIS